MKWLMFAWKNVMRNRRRSLTAMLITALGTAAVLASGGFALYTYESLEEMTARDTGHVVVAHARGFEGDEDVPLQHGLADALPAALRQHAQPGDPALVLSPAEHGQADNRLADDGHARAVQVDIVEGDVLIQPIGVHRHGNEVVSACLVIRLRQLVKREFGRRQKDHFTVLL